MMTDVVLLEPIQKWCGSVFDLRLLDHHNTLKVWVDSAGFEVGTNCNIGVVAWSIRVVNATETLVKQVIETLMYVVSLAHYDRVTFNG